MTKKKTQERMTTTTTAEHYNSAKRSTCTSSTGIELLHRNAYGRARLIQKTTHRESRWNPFHGARRKENKKNRTGAVRARAKTTTTARTAATTTTTEKTVKKWTETVVAKSCSRFHAAKPFSSDSLYVTLHTRVYINVCAGLKAY